MVKRTSLASGRLEEPPGFQLVGNRRSALRLNSLSKNAASKFVESVTSLRWCAVPRIHYPLCGKVQIGSFRFDKYA
jgi:hypothetical protein